MIRITAKIKNRKGQATAEIAVFGALILLALGALLNYTRTIREQQLTEQQVFRQALKDANEHEFEVTNIYEEKVKDYGATVSSSKTLDKQANLLFEPNRRSYSAGYSVFWSGAEDSPELNKTEVNKDTIIKTGYEDGDVGATPKYRKKIKYFRDEGAFETPDKELKLSTLDLVMTIAPAVATVALASKTVTNYLENLIGKGAAPAISFALRAASFGDFCAKYYEAMGNMEDAEARREELEDQDEQMSKWGWRVATEVKDKDDGIEAGKYYVKEIDAETFDTSSTSSTVSSFTEAKVEDSSRIANNRSVNLTDTINRIFKLRYDVTAPDPVIPILDQDLIALEPKNHTYEYVSDDASFADINLGQGFGGDRAYSSSDLGATVTQEKGWVTPH